MGNDLNPGTLVITTCGEVISPITYQPLTVDLANAFFNAGCPLTTEELIAIDNIVINSSDGHDSTYALPILTLDRTGITSRTELIGAIALVGAFLEGQPLNVIVDSGMADITLNPGTGVVTLHLGSSDYSGQRLFLQYKK